MKNRYFLQQTTPPGPARHLLAAICALALAFASNPARAAGPAGSETATNEPAPVPTSKDSPAIAKAREMVRQRMDAIAQQEAAGAKSKAPAKAPAQASQS